MRQRRRKPAIPHDDIWSIFTNEPPPFRETPIKAVPWMDSGISPAFELHHTRTRRTDALRRERDLATPSVAATFEDELRFHPPTGGSTVPVNAMVSTSQLAQQDVFRRGVPSTAATNKRCLVDRLRSNIQFGYTTLESKFLKLERDALPLKPNRIRSGATKGDSQARTPPLLTTPMSAPAFACRSVTAMGNGCVVEAAAGAATELCLPIQSHHSHRNRPSSQMHHLTRDCERQEEILVRRARDVAFSRVFRAPRPKHKEERNQVLVIS